MYLTSSHTSKYEQLEIPMMGSVSAETRRSKDMTEYYHLLQKD